MTLVLVKSTLWIIPSFSMMNTSSTLGFRRLILNICSTSMIPIFLSAQSTWPSLPQHFSTTREKLWSVKFFNLILKKYGKSMFPVLDATKFQLMNKEDERCEENENYSFTSCIRVRKSPGKYPGIFLFLEFCQQDGGMSVTLGLLVRSNDESLSKCESNW